MGPLAAPLIMAGGSVLAGMLGKGKGTTVNQGPLETPEQAAARRRLLARANEDPRYAGSLGDFEMTGAERAGSSRLMSMLDRGAPGITGSAVSTLDDLLMGDRFDPTARGGEYEAFQAQNRRSGDRALAATKRAAAFGGNLYSSDTIRNVGDVEAQVEINAMNKLAELNDRYVTRKLGAVPYALDAGKTLQGMDLNAINAAYTYGALPRTLNTAADQAAYGEFVRGQGVTDSRLGTVAGGPPQFGPSSYTQPSDGGAWGRVSDLLAYGAGNLLGRGGTETSTMAAGGEGMMGGNLDLYNPYQQMPSKMYWGGY